MNAYRHRQSGRRLLIVVLVGAVFAATAVARQQRPVWASALIVVVLVGLAFVFTSLTVSVDERGLEFWFGPGVFRKRYDLADIAEAHAVRNPWWYGWGIHRTPHGWLYNVAGAEAVELRLVNGTTLRVGTDEPARLLDAIRRARAARG